MKRLFLIAVYNLSAWFGAEGLREWAYLKWFKHYMENDADGMGYFMFAEDFFAHTTDGTRKRKAA